MEYYFNPNQQRIEFIMFVHHQRKHYLLFLVLCLIYQICSIDAFKHNMNLKKKGYLYQMQLQQHQQCRNTCDTFHYSLGILKTL